MSSTIHSTELSINLLSFLQEEGYSHILSAGAAETELGPDGGTDDYRLIAVKSDDPRLQYQETEYIIAAINSSEVKEMAAGVEFIRFMIEIPKHLFEAYLNKQ